MSEQKCPNCGEHRKMPQVCPDCGASVKPSPSLPRRVGYAECGRRVKASIDFSDWHFDLANVPCLERQLAQAVERAEKAEAESARLREQRKEDERLMGWTREVLKVFYRGQESSTTEALNERLGSKQVAEAENKRLREAFHAAINRPKGIVPAGYEDLYDPKAASKEADDA